MVFGQLVDLRTVFLCLILVSCGVSGFFRCFLEVYFCEVMYIVPVCGPVWCFAFL